MRDAKAGLLPAVTHVDQTSRVQTVRKEDGARYDCLTHLKHMGAIPGVLNTSYNGPGQPIVQSPHDAMAMMLRDGLDAVFLNGMKLVKAPASAG